MKKLIVLGSGGAVAFAAAAASMVMFGSGVAAAAPDVAGMVYSDALETIEEDGLTPIVATRVGSRETDDDCVVDRVQDANFLDGVGEAAEDTILVYLNCNAAPASATAPGYSAGNTGPVPEALRDAIAEEEAAAAEEEAAAAAEAAAAPTEEELTAANQS